MYVTQPKPVGQVLWRDKQSLIAHENRQEMKLCGLGLLAFLIQQFQDEPMRHTTFPAQPCCIVVLTVLALPRWGCFLITVMVQALRQAGLMHCAGGLLRQHSAYQHA